MNMYRLHDEPKLNELLADPILHLLLKRDGVSLEELQDLIEQARRRRWTAKRAQLQ
jgi:mevalonate kinase